DDLVPRALVTRGRAGNQGDHVRVVTHVEFALVCDRIEPRILLPPCCHSPLKGSLLAQVPPVIDGGRRYRSDTPRSTFRALLSVSFGRDTHTVPLGNAGEADPDWPTSASTAWTGPSGVCGRGSHGQLRHGQFPDIRMRSGERLAGGVVDD